MVSLLSLGVRGKDSKRRNKEINHVKFNH
jgi:hypothetical protein